MVLVLPIEIAHPVDKDVFIILVGCPHISWIVYRENVGVSHNIETEFVA